MPRKSIVLVLVRPPVGAGALPGGRGGGGPGEGGGGGAAGEAARAGRPGGGGRRGDARGVRGGRGGGGTGGGGGRKGRRRGGRGRPRGEGSNEGAPTTLLPPGPGGREERAGGPQAGGWGGLAPHVWKGGGGGPTGGNRAPAPIPWTAWPGGVGGFLGPPGGQRGHDGVFGLGGGQGLAGRGGGPPPPEGGEGFQRGGGQPHRDAPGLGGHADRSRAWNLPRRPGRHAGVRQLPEQPGRLVRAPAQGDLGRRRPRLGQEPGRPPPAQGQGVLVRRVVLDQRRRRRRRRERLQVPRRVGQPQHGDADVAVPLRPPARPLGWRSGPPTYYASKFPKDVIEHWAFFVSQNATAEAIAAQARRVFESKGFKVVYTRNVPPNDSNQTADVVQMKQAGVRSLTWRRPRQHDQAGQRHAAAELRGRPAQLGRRHVRLEHVQAHRRRRSGEHRARLRLRHVPRGGRGRRSPRSSSSSTG